jgi:hypothetical protein
LYLLLYYFLVLKPNLGLSAATFEFDLFNKFFTTLTNKLCEGGLLCVFREVGGLYGATLLETPPLVVTLLGLDLGLGFIFGLGLITFLGLLTGILIFIL